MYFIEKYNKENILLFDFSDSKITIENKDFLFSLKEKVYCYDLYKIKEIYGSVRSGFPTVFDLQCLYGILLNKSEEIYDLFEKEKEYKFFELKQKIDCHLKSYRVCNLSVVDIELDKLIPKYLYTEFQIEKSNSIKRLISNFNNKEALNYYSKNFDNIISIIEQSDKEILVNNRPEKLYFNIFGSKNSRLTAKKNTFNVFNLPKEKRACITAPERFKLVQVDFKSFQPRLALSLFGNDLIKNKLVLNRDVYSLFEGDREEIKLSLISWMFSNRRNKIFDKELTCILNGRKELYKKVKQDKFLLNPFERPLFFLDNEEENVIFQNYICSVEADCIISLMKSITQKIEEKNLKSQLLFSLHDCIFLLIFDEEFDTINWIKEYAENYLFEQLKMVFPVEVLIGKDLYNLSKYEEAQMR